jgi:hypothetical protein
MHSIRVALGHRGLISFRPFMKVLAPHCDADR